MKVVVDAMKVVVEWLNPQANGTPVDPGSRCGKPRHVPPVVVRQAGARKIPSHQDWQGLEVSAKHTSNRGLPSRRTGHAA